MVTYFLFRSLMLPPTKERANRVDGRRQKNRLSEKRRLVLRIFGNESESSVFLFIVMSWDGRVYHEIYNIYYLIL